MSEIATRVAATLLASVFAWAAVAKLVSFRAWRGALTGYDLRSGAAAWVAALVPTGEIALAALLLLAPVKVGAALAVGLLGLFSLAIVRAQARRGARLPCGCFGRANARDYRVMLARNGLLTAIAAALLLGGRELTVLGDMSAPQGAQVVPAALIVVGVGAAIWTARQVSMSTERRRSH